MNWADWAIVGILVLSSLIGVIRGLVREALSLAVWASALVIAVSLSQHLAILLEPYIQTASVRHMSAFGLLFVLTLIAGAMASYLISTLVKMTGLSGTDRMLGIVFGALRGFIVVMAILLFVPPIVPVNEDPWWSESALIPHFLTMEDVTRAGFDYVVDLVKNLFGYVPQDNQI